MNRINKNIIAGAIFVCLSIFLYFHRILKIHLYTGEWHFNLVDYYKEYFGKYLVLYLLLVVLFVIFWIWLESRKNRAKKQMEDNSNKLG